MVVEKALSPINYVVRNPVNGATQTVHVQRLARWQPVAPQGKRGVGPCLAIFCHQPLALFSSSIFFSFFYFFSLLSSSDSALSIHLSPLPFSLLCAQTKRPVGLALEPPMRRRRLAVPRMAALGLGLAAICVVGVLGGWGARAAAFNFGG
jgi:hypothetical protein